MVTSAIFEFRLPGTIITGPGSFARLGEQAKARGVHKALIVTDANLRLLPLVDQARQYLADVTIAADMFDGVTIEPLEPDVHAGIAAFRAGGCDGVIAVGGGSSIDVAKSVAALATSGGRMAQYEGANKITGRQASLIAVPTTAGTGSEVTRNAIITDVERDVKMLIQSPHLIPDVAIVDPLLTLTLPPDGTMATGIDALTHAIEAYVSRRAQPITDALALEAIRLVAGNLRQAWANPDDLDARSAMARASLVAGMAFGNSTVALVHGMARPIGAHFHLSHGLSNACILAVVMEYSLIGNPPRFADIAEAMGERVHRLSLMDAARKSVDAVRRLCDDVRVPTLAGAGVDPGRLRELAPKMAADAIASGSPGNNPRRASVEDIVGLYEQAV
jgi:alcohol dehydrogenase class IV